MKGLLAAHALPAQRIGDAVRAFWPLPVVWALGLQTGLVFDGRDPQTLVGVDDAAPWIFALTALALYGGLLAARGAVSWHRMMIYGEPVPWTPPVPSWRGFIYALWILGLSILFGLVIALLGGIVLTPILSYVFGGSVDAPVINMGAVVLAVVVGFALYAVVLFLLAGPILNLPTSAVEAPDRPEANGAARLILVGTALIVPLAYTILGSVLPVPDPLGIVAALVNSYASLVALTGLSIAYREARGRMVG